MPLGPHDRAPETVVRDGRKFHALGLTVSAGWHDDRGRQYDGSFRLICEGCGCVAGEVLGDEDDATLRGKVTTDSQGRTFCKACRHQADVLGHDPREVGAIL